MCIAEMCLCIPVPFSKIMYMYTCTSNAGQKPLVKKKNVLLFIVIYLLFILFLLLLLFYYFFIIDYYLLYYHYYLEISCVLMLLPGPL